MTLFDRYIAVDWSANNAPKSGKDSIWIGEASRNGVLRASENPRTRSLAMADIRQRCASAIATGQRLLIGFDFAFGYPAGSAAALCGGHLSWEAIWSRLTDAVIDDAGNVSNRFLAAATINGLGGNGSPRYWGHPWQHTYEGLTRTKPQDNHLLVAEKRQVEVRNHRAQPVWKLSGIGAVGSQAFLGIPGLQHLRTDPELAQHVAIWPFETHFAEDLTKSVIVAEIFPSIIDIVAAKGEIRDRLQVEAIATLFARADEGGELVTLLGAAPDLAVDDLGKVLAEEGWIVGVGHEELVARLRALP